MGGLAEMEQPSEAQLLDVLYELLAQGTPALESGLTRAEVERFLHEHAREKKPRSELLRFFDVHGLPTEPSEVSVDKDLGALARGLQRERTSRTPSLPAPLLPGMSEVDSEPPVSNVRGRRPSDPVADVPDERTAPRVRRPRRGLADATHRALLGVLGVVVVALSVALGVCVWRIEAMARSLAEAQLAERAAATTLEAERTRAAALEAREREAQLALARRDAQLAEAERAREVDEQRYIAENRILARVLGNRFWMERRQLVKMGVLPPSF
ncbi:MAG: hypothetical protein ABW252_11435 [Polyangiales bacterium]